MAQAPATHPADEAPHEPTALEKMAKEIGGDKNKLVAALAAQARWNWDDVAVLVLHSHKALADCVKAMNEETEKRAKEASDAEHKREEAIAKGLEGAEAPRHPGAAPSTATTATQHR